MTDHPFVTSLSPLRLSVQAALLSLFAVPACRVLPLRVTLRLAAGKGSGTVFPRAKGGKTVPDPVLLARLVERVSARLAGATCLTRAVALYGVLRRHGLEAELVVGARRNSTHLEAHAWVLHQGRVVIGEAGHDAYEPIAQFACPDSSGRVA